MDNTINSSNILTRNNAMFVGVAGVGGALGGVIKTNFIDIPDIKRGLKQKYKEFEESVQFNNRTIKDEFVREATNKDLANKFDRLREYCCNEGIKKISKKNIIYGAIIGILAGIIGVIIKNKLNKDTDSANASNINKTLYYKIQK